MKKNSTLWAAYALVGLFAYGCTVTVDNNPSDGGSLFDSGGSLNTGGSNVGTGGSTVGTGGTTTVDTDSGTPDTAVGTGGTVTADAGTQPEAATLTWAFSAPCRACLDTCAGSSMTSCAADAACNSAIAEFSNCLKTSTLDACSAPFGGYTSGTPIADYTTDISYCLGSSCELNCAQPDAG